MDNFEYSIQINDRDWEEFYSTAEECGLTQVSLASEEELGLSETESKDTANCKKPKFIRISLCPPPQEEHPPLQISQPVVSQSVQTSNKWLIPNEDILSGSEDEEELGSVTRFLCQKEYMLQKRESEQMIDIPLTKLIDHDDVSSPLNENSRINSVGEGLAEYMRTRNLGNNVQYKVESQHHMGKIPMEKIINTQVELEDPGAGPMVSVQPDGNPRSSANLSYPNNSPYFAHEIESCSSVNGYLQDENIPDVNRSGDEIGHEATLSGRLSKDDCFEIEHGTLDGPTSLEEPPSFMHNGLVYYTVENDVPDNRCEVVTEANVNSSAVEKNVPTSTIEEFHSCISQSNSLNIEARGTSNTHDPVDNTTSTYSLVPDTTTRAWRNQAPLTQPSSVHDRKTVLTLPEMYDFFFDDVLDIGSLETESNMARQEEIAYTPERATSNTHDPLDYTTSIHSLEPINITPRALRNQIPPNQPSSAHDRKTVLTLPEMYDFFFDDVSDIESLETESNMARQEGILHTPERATSNRHDPVDYTTSIHSLEPINITTRAWRNQIPPTQPSSVHDRKTVLTLPEMYDFFFDDVLDIESLETESNMVRQEGILHTPERATSNRPDPVDYTTSTHSLEPINITTRAWRNLKPPTQPSLAHYRETALTLPEMYDFFFDDVSDIASLETETNMASQEGIVYTPEMYEYFFLEDEEEHRAESRGGNTSQASSTDLALASTSSEVASWPEACEFFFADGPQDQGREGILFRIPSSQVQSAADIIRSFIPEGLKGFTVRRARPRRALGESLIPREHQGTSGESSVSTSDSIAPYLSPSRSDACLVFLALASWAVKSSDLQSSDGWKTALLANIGAVSAIQYLRRRRRTWENSPPQTGDET